MHPADIKAALEKKGRPAVKVARRLHINKATVSRVIHGRDTSRRVADEISRVTGIPISQLWPGRYEERRAA